MHPLTQSEIPLVMPLLSNGEPNSSLVVIAGLSGVGAKGSLAYGLLAANQVLGKSDDDKLYRKALRLMGPERLAQDLIALEKEQARKIAEVNVFERGFLFKGN